MAAEKAQNQALEQTRDSIQRYGEPFGRELLNLVVRRHSRMTTFEALYYRAAAADVSPELRPLLAQLHLAINSEPRDFAAIRASLIRLLAFLAGPQGRTDANCRAVDSFFMLDESWLDLPDALHDILADMDGTLHDTISAPDIAHNFDSTPEQLLARARSTDSNHDA